MPSGPNGEKRPADVNACAVMVAKIATGEIKEERVEIDTRRSAAGRKGAKARKRKLTAQRRSEIGRNAANARWAAPKNR